MKDDLEEYLKSTYGISPAPTPSEIEMFVRKVSVLPKAPTSAELEKIASQIFKGFRKGKFKFNDSYADTVHDILKLIKKKLGK